MKNLQCLVATTFIFALAVSGGLGTGPGDAQTAPATAGPMQFDTPTQAANALIAAAGAYDVPKLVAILGPQGKDLVASADPVGDKKNAVAFAAEARRYLNISTNAASPNTAQLIVGTEKWPMPIPLVKSNGKWSFDAAAGKQEILYRRIGSNELDAITLSLGYVDAQRSYALTIHDNSGINQYAQKIFSSPGKQDGLYWQNADGSAGGPIGETIAKALNEGYSIGKGGYHGYYFKILTGQGANAPGGRIDYVLQGVMIGGFALAAVPAQYRVTGVMSFIVNNDGVVYQKDLGTKSASIVKNMTLYNPDPSWKATYDRWPRSVAPVGPAAP